MVTLSSAKRKSSAANLNGPPPVLSKWDGRRPGKDMLGNYSACDNLQDAIDCPVTGLPQTLYALQHSEFPMTDAEAEAKFDDEINYFAMSVSSQVSGDQSGNLISTSSPRSPFLAKSLCIVIWVDPWQSAIAGSAQTLPTTTTTTPVFTGDIAFGGAPRPASFRLGWDVLEAAQAYIASYRINMWLGGQLKVVDELVRHVGTVESNNRASGYGNAQRSIADWIKEANRRQREIGSTLSFLPITAQASGDTTKGVLPPLVNQQVGSVIAEGAFGCCFPIKPMLMLPGMPIDIQLVREVGSDIDHDRLLRAATFQSSGTTYDEKWTEGLTGSTGYAVDYQFKYGELVIGLMYRGLQLTPRCCLDWYYNFGYWQSPAMIGEDVVMRKLATYADALGMRLPKPRDPRANVPMLSGFNPSNAKQMEEYEQMFEKPVGPKGQFSRTGSIDPYEKLP